MRRFPLSIFLAVLFCVPSFGFAAQIIVHAAGIRSASSLAETRGAQAVVGQVDGDRIVFPDLTAGVAYSLRLTRIDGSIEQGFDAGWYDKEPPREDAGELTADDRQQINAILTQVLSFYNKNELLQLIGNHDRATGLVQLIRDKKFHSDAGDEVIWHVELWYLKNRHGGWENTQQANKILRRERFATEAAFHAAVDKLHWRPELGGLVIPIGQNVLDVTPAR